MNVDKKPKVLVVDDNEIARYARVRILNKSGFETTEAINGADTVEKISSMVPDLILLDVKLPDISGFEIVRKIKEDERFKFTPIILISSFYNDVSDKVEGLNSGADGYLIEPVDSSELLTTISISIKLAKTQKELVEKECRFRGILENARDMIYQFMLYPEPHFSYVAPSSTKIIGYTPEEHYADSELLFKIIHPEDKLILKKVFKELNPSDTPIVIRYVHKDGHTVWTEMVISPIYNSDRKITGFDSISRDITEQTIFEEDKEKAILELEKALFEIKTLQGLIPICAGCKKIRNDKDYWENIEIYLKQHLDVQFTHGLCPDCIRKYYPEYVNEIEKQNKHTSGNNN